MRKCHYWVWNNKDEISTLVKLIDGFSSHSHYQSHTQPHYLEK